MSYQEYIPPRHTVVPWVSVDVVIFTIIDEQLSVLTIKRAIEPYKDRWTLVGGFIDIDKDICLDDAAKRKLYEKTGIDAPYLIQSESIGNAHRDPRGWSLTIVYYALIPVNSVHFYAGVNADDIQWMTVDNVLKENILAFDHQHILANAVRKLQTDILSSTIPIHLMPELFTIKELQHMYECILKKKIDPKSFRRRIMAADILVATTEKKIDNCRPATLYKRNSGKLEHYFIRALESAIN